MFAAYGSILQHVFHQIMACMNSTSTKPNSWGKGTLEQTSISMIRTFGPCHVWYYWHRQGAIKLFWLHFPLISHWSVIDQSMISQWSVNDRDAQNLVTLVDNSILCSNLNLYEFLSKPYSLYFNNCERSCQITTDYWYFFFFLSTAAAGMIQQLLVKEGERTKPMKPIRG